MGQRPVRSTCDEDLGLFQYPILGPRYQSHKLIRETEILPKLIHNIIHIRQNPTQNAIRLREAWFGPRDLVVKFDGEKLDCGDSVVKDYFESNSVATNRGAALSTACFKLSLR